MHILFLTMHLYNQLHYFVNYFHRPEDASKAMEASQGKTFFGAKIKVAPHEGVEVDDPDKLNDNDCMDEYHVKSTRTLFVGNLEKDTTKQDLIDKFKEYGKIIVSWNHISTAVKLRFSKLFMYYDVD